jgi:hypothetical protein
MPNEKAKNGLRKPFPGEKIPESLKGCTTASEVESKVQTLNARALGRSSWENWLKMAVNFVILIGFDRFFANGYLLHSGSPKMLWSRFCTDNAT